MIDLRTLGVFLAIGDCGNFTRAAQRLGRSQSAVSQAIRQLEEDLGVVLIDRTTRPMLLTPSGVVLREHALRLIRDTETLVATVRDYGHAKVGEVRLGLVQSFAAVAGPALTRTLLDHAVGLTVWTELTSILTEAFLQRKVDMIIGNDALDEVDGLVRFDLMSESYLLLAPADVAIESTDAGLEALARNHPMIRYRPQSFLGGQIEQQLLRRNVHPTRPVSVDMSDSLIAMVAAGIGWASTTPLCLLQGRVFLSRINVVPFPEPRFFRRLTLVARSGEFGALPGRLARVASHILATEVLPELRRLNPAMGDALSVRVRRDPADTSTAPSRRQ
ncbi:MAG: LysR family transcriptional regulator [Burkholderiales bacterium]|nr:LysR family transcriptional regulator [Burkholderiales bacterium]